MLIVSCQCGLQFQAAEHLAGEKIPCPGCGRMLSVPAGQRTQPKPLTPASTPSALKTTLVVALAIGGGVVALFLGLILVVAMTSSDTPTPEVAVLSNPPSSEAASEPAKAPLGVAPPVGVSPTSKSAGDAGTINLLKLDRNAARLQGSWRISGETLFSPVSKPAYYIFPTELPANYRLEADIEVLGGEGSFSLIVVVAGQPVSVVLDGWGSYKSGLSLVGGRSGDRNSTTHSGQLLTTGRMHHVVVIVRGNRVDVDVDEKEVIRWNGPPSQLSVDRRFWPEVGKRPALGSWLTHYKVTRLELSQL